MTVSSGFFNSVNHDRLYDAEQLSSIFDGLIIDGVYENYGEAFMVTANPDANSSVIIGIGRAWFDHTWTFNDSQFAMQLDPPNEMLGRTDAIVLDINHETDTRKNSILYLKGSESTPDLPPAFVKTEHHKQFPICYISRPAGTDSPISQSQITITVGTSVCPFVTGILEAQNLENLMRQLDDEFNTWWDGIKEVLDDNIATNLQNQIDELKEKIEGEGALVGLLEKGIADSFVSGNYGLSVKSYTFNIPQYAGSYDTGRMCDVNGCSTILPDGKVAVFYTSRATSGASQLTFVVDLYNTDGVKTQKTHSVGAGNDATYWGKINNLFFQIDTYPVTLMFSNMALNSNSSGKQVCNVITVQITSTGEVYISEGAFTENDKNDIFYTASQNVVFGSSCKLSDGSYVVGGYERTNRSSSVPEDALATFFKISSDGVILSTKTASTNYISQYAADDTKIGSARIHNVNGTPTVWLYTNISVSADPNTLAITTNSSASAEPDSFTSGEITNNHAQAYTLSETSGVMVTTADPGQSYNGLTSKKSNYFLGASNLGDPLYEGVYMANVNSSNQLYGLGSGGVQIAIGSNGGAAILKTKAGTFTMSAFKDIMKYYKGYLNTSSSTQYLFCPITRTRDFSNVTQTVLTLRKGA